MQTVDSDSPCRARYLSLTKTPALTHTHTDTHLAHMLCCICVVIAALICCSSLPIAIRFDSAIVVYILHIVIQVWTYHSLTDSPTHPPTQLATQLFVRLLVRGGAHCANGMRSLTCRSCYPNAQRAELSKQCLQYLSETIRNILFIRAMQCKRLNFIVFPDFCTCFLFILFERCELFSCSQSNK